MITIATLILCSCSVLRNYDTDGLTYEGTKHIL